MVTEKDVEKSTILLEGQVEARRVQNALVDERATSNREMISRRRRFPEVMVVDATYNTNNAKMPLISVQGVSNLGG
ncbi:hypothetical protein DFQ28_004727, partial [Apophysomyces sp. BC1034]